MDSAWLSPPTSASNSPIDPGTKRNKLFLPLSSHGMPKAPSSPDGGLPPHRFSRLAPSLTISSPPMTPMSPGPMSARSVGTFIDTAPSTPAFSPRQDSGWDSSTLVVLSPVPSTHSSPPEPDWTMMKPLKPKPLPLRLQTSPVSVSSIDSKLSSGTSLSSHPLGPRMPAMEKPQGSQNEKWPPDIEDNPDADVEKKEKEEQEHHGDPLGRIATRMRSMLRRKTATVKKSAAERRMEKRRKYAELDRMEDVHWTEM